ncbi:hypothetical protein CLE01_34260 [Cryobacterium levicorallinum]|nr:hypothetical protein CLE01_34260 [Cryobacterium levicorallinum]
MPYDRDETSPALGLQHIPQDLSYQEIRVSKPIQGANPFLTPIE